MNGPMNASVASQRRGEEEEEEMYFLKQRRKLLRKVFVRIKESKWGASCKYM